MTMLLPYTPDQYPILSKIVSAVSWASGVPVHDICGERRQDRIATARLASFYLAAENTGLSDSEIGQQLEDGRNEYKKPLGSGIAYLFCDSVDAYFAQVQAKGVTVKHSPHDAPYGMRDFMIADLDGNHLAFGNEIQEA